MKIVETPRLIVRNWEEGDRDLFYEINSDPQVMAFFAFRRSREQADAFMEVMRERIRETGYGFYALELKETGEPIGFCGLSRTALEPHIPEGTVEIGWRLAKRHWGKGYVTEAGRELLRYGFEDLGLDRIVSFAVHDNERSTAVMRRLGMARVPGRDFDHPSIPDTHPDLKRHVFFELTREDWLEAVRGNPA